MCVCKKIYVFIFSSIFFFSRCWFHLVQGYLWYVHGKKSKFRSQSLHVLESPAASFPNRLKKKWLYKHTYINSLFDFKKRNQSWIHWILVGNLHIVHTHTWNIDAVSACISASVSQLASSPSFYVVLFIVFAVFFLLLLKVRVYVFCLHSRSSNNRTFSLSRSELNIHKKVTKKSQAFNQYDQIKIVTILKRQQ